MKSFYFFILGIFALFGSLCSLPTIADAQSKSNELSALKLIQSARALATAPLQKERFGIGFKNTGTTIWSIHDPVTITLRSSAKNESYFHDSTWAGKNVVMALPQDTKPGEIVYFWFTLEAPAKEKSYIEELSLYQGNKKISGTTASIPIAVAKKNSIPDEKIAQNLSSVKTAAADQTTQAPSSPIGASPPVISLVTPAANGTFLATKLIQSAQSLTIKQAEHIRFGIGYKNSGTAAWKKGDSIPISLRSSATKESYFYDPTWKTQNIVADLSQDIGSGELVYFWFTLYAPIFPGNYQEKLYLVKNGEKILGSDVSIPITVLPTSSNILTSTATTQLQEQNASLIETQPPITPTSDGMSDAPIPAMVQTPLSGIVDDRTEQESLIRVGLFSTKDPVRITANKDYEIRDSDGTLLTVEAAGSVSTIVFDWTLKAYSLTTSKVSLGTVKYLRFSGVQADSTAVQSAISSTNQPAVKDIVLAPKDSSSVASPQTPSISLVPPVSDQDIIFEIPSYVNHPSWSSSLNDNTFRSTLEVRYAPQTNRLWVVNELKLEQYLKGIGETSNSSPYEYQKTLIIAARTYAKYHIDRSTKHAADGFTVSPTEADQVYRGYGAEKRLPNVARAVDETRGIIVTYGGALAITPYYSQSDGRTRSWGEVWGGQPMPWLVGKPDPYCAGLPMLGHGVGMSARGAIGMALDNKSFEEILKYYYTGIELRRKY